ncbi:MAG: type III polyketide synthase [Candidatus Cohnella colombiensis]|uniref:Type III polyketide synthase n=1 Tax=Candidatus Cohnella colombiensis TaxID=3121368 RepID=A0AA95EZQ2_9BACL|nr:MAG: type III polyketide synthase [Cohnella sp.]
MEHLSIMGIGTAVPAYCLDQEDAVRRMKQALKDRPEDAKWMHRIFTHCGVNTRYTCEPNLLERADLCRYVPTTQDTNIPTTDERMSIYQKESVGLALEAAQKALEDSGNHPSDITHLITVSCTGLFLPGLDAELSWHLDLRSDVQRIPLTFMGCAAGLTALRVSEQIVRSNPNATVLVVTVELCSLHIQPSFEKEQLFTAAFFGDGASACVVGTADLANKGMLTIHKAQEVIIPNTSTKMKWTVGNYGFQLQLSPEIPRIIAKEVPDVFRLFWEDESLPDLWAIHPGGRGIIDSLQASFDLTDAQTESSRSILHRYGNMSSATILFVLADIRQRLLDNAEGDKDGIALAFGPGITAELIRFSYHP